MKIKPFGLRTTTRTNSPAVSSSTTTPHINATPRTPSVERTTASSAGAGEFNFSYTSALNNDQDVVKFIRFLSIPDPVDGVNVKTWKSNICKGLTTAIAQPYLYRADVGASASVHDCISWLYKLTGPRAAWLTKDSSSKYWGQNASAKAIELLLPVGTSLAGKNCIVARASTTSKQCGHGYLVITHFGRTFSLDLTPGKMTPEGKKQGVINLIEYDTKVGIGSQKTGIAKDQYKEGYFIVGQQRNTTVASDKRNNFAIQIKDMPSEWIWGLNGKKSVLL